MVAVAHILENSVVSVEESPCSGVVVDGRSKIIVVKKSRRKALPPATCTHSSHVVVGSRSLKCQGGKVVESFQEANKVRVSERVTTVRATSEEQENGGDAC